MYVHILSVDGNDITYVLPVSGILLCFLNTILDIFIFCASLQIEIC